MGIKTTGSVLTLQCLDGKDQQFKIELENGKQVIFGSQTGNIFINELEKENGSIHIVQLLCHFITYFVQFITIHVSLSSPFYHLAQHYKTKKLKT